MIPPCHDGEGAVKPKLPRLCCLYETDKETEQTFELARSLRGHGCIAGIWVSGTTGRISHNLNFLKKDAFSSYFLASSSVNSTKVNHCPLRTSISISQSCFFPCICSFFLTKESILHQRFLLFFFPKLVRVWSCSSYLAVKPSGSRVTS